MSGYIKSSIEVGDKGVIDLKCLCELTVEYILTELSSPEQLQMLWDAADAMLQCVPRKHPADPI